MHRRSTLRSARGKPQRTIWLCILSSIALCAIVNYYWIASGGGDETPEPESVHLRRASSSQGPPRGQHLSLDLVGASFHSTETAMHDITRKMLSSIGITSQLATSTSAPLNGGVSVMMAFQDYSQFTIQTWPEHERAIIDLFIRGGPDESINLQDALPIICQAYGADLAKSTFSITPRGDHTRASTNGEDSSSDDTTEKKKNHFHPVEIMSQHKVKTKIYEKQSPFQHIAIWDHHDFTDDDYETTMTRSLFLDGVIQSNIHDEARYHESLVHTAFIAASTPPKRVLIVGGGEGATLRETLKWASVEHVTMVDLDPDVIDASRRFLPSYSKCTGFGAASCFDDDRLDLYTEDFIAWFDKHIGNDICEKQEEKKDLLYDVIIIDLLDTEELPEGQAWAEHLYSELFFERIACALHTFGVVVSNFGEAPWFVGGEIQVSVHEKKMQAMFQKKIQQIQTMSSFFHHSRVYDTFVHSYRSDWAFAIGISPYNDAAEEGEEFKRALKDYGNVGINDFDGTPARVNLKLRRGLKQNAYPLQHYDGAVQHGFQYPIADWVSPYCADPAHEQICSISKKLFSVDYEEEWFEPRLNGNHDGKSGSFAKKDIKKGHVTGLWDAATA